VVDLDTLDVRYGSIFALMADLRQMGAGNVLIRRGQVLTRAVLVGAADHFAQAAAADGKTAERFVLLYLSGWKPAPSQPKPARRGSATVSLADALKGDPSNPR
jgi:hypothetical protein